MGGHGGWRREREQARREERQLKSTLLCCARRTFPPLKPPSSESARPRYRSRGVSWPADAVASRSSSRCGCCVPRSSPRLALGITALAVVVMVAAMHTGLLDGRVGQVLRLLGKRADASAQQRGKADAGWSKPVVLLLGDGLTEYGFHPLQPSGGTELTAPSGAAVAGEGEALVVGGWVSGLSSWYGHRADVLNRGLAGYNAKAGLSAAGRLFDNHTPSGRVLLGVVWYGAADSADASLNPTQHVPLDEFTASLATITSTVRSSGAEVTMLVTPPPASGVLNGEALSRQSQFCAGRGDSGPAEGPVVGEGILDGGFISPCRVLAWSNPAGLAEHSIALARRYATAVRELGRRLGCPVVDLWSLKVTGHSAAHWATDGLLASDGVSLTAAGHAVVLAAVQHTITTEAASALPDQVVQPVQPSWYAEALDPAAPAQPRSPAAQPGGAPLRPLSLPAAIVIAANVTNCAREAVELAMVLATPAGDAAHEASLKVEQEEIDLGIVLLCMLLVAAVVIGHSLETYQIHRLHAAGAALLLGAAAGWGVELIAGGGSGTRTALERVARFDGEFFFRFLLPPIIFESGYNMQRRKFFQNLGAICIFAFIGTTVSAAVVGWLVWASGAAATATGTGLSGVEALAFGALISATDPVTVLAVFGSAGANHDLHALVFGESVLNDAVAIVLYRSLEQFSPANCGEGASGGACEASAQTILAAIGSAAWIFSGSVSIGGALASGSSLLHKYLRLRNSGQAHFVVETVLLLMVPYAAWMLAEASSLSGIVAILFCGAEILIVTDLPKAAFDQRVSPERLSEVFFPFSGIGMAHYTTLNLHPETLTFRYALGVSKINTQCELNELVYKATARPG